MRGSSLGAAAALAFALFSSSSADAEPERVNTPPVIVVEVTGDRFDAAHLRERIGKELGRTAVAPDDPHAAEATGRVDLVSKNGERSLTATYRKMDAPVTRTIEVANDAARAEDDAVFLVGNLARDEASDLVPEKPPEKEKPRADTASARITHSAEPGFDPDKRDLAQLRAFLLEAEEHEHNARITTGIASLALSAAILAPAIYLYTVDDASGAAKAFRSGALGFGAAFALGGILQLTIEGDAHAAIARRLREQERAGKSAGETVHLVESYWAERADQQRSMRKAGGIFGMVVGGALVGTGTAFAFAEGPHQDSYSTAPLLYAAGGFLLVFGATTIAIESSLESNYRMWRTAKSDPTTGGRPSASFGIAPTRGGAAASFMLQF